MGISLRNKSKAIVLIIALLSAVSVYAEELAYKCDLGLQGGVSYYVGDGNPHIFMHPQYAYGVQFRYKFDPRWSLQAKVQGQKIKFRMPEGSGDEKGTNQLWNLDVVGEFNFFRFGAKQYDDRIKQITPYIFLGIGVGAYSGFEAFGAYMPFGFGMKWKFAEHCQLHVAWQHQLFFADNVEGVNDMNNFDGMNGSNVLHNDLTSTLTVGIVFEFAKEKEVCRQCGYYRRR